MCVPSIGVRQGGREKRQGGREREVGSAGTGDRWCESQRGREGEVGREAQGLRESVGSRRKGNAHGIVNEKRKRRCN